FRPSRDRTASAAAFHKSGSAFILLGQTKIVVVQKNQSTRRPETRQAARREKRSLLTGRLWGGARFEQRYLLENCFDRMFVAEFRIDHQVVKRPERPFLAEVVA